MIDVDALAKLRTSGIYAFFNLMTGMWYVGQATNIYNRRSRHTVGLHCGQGQNSHLQAAYNKYGDDSFAFMVLEYCEPDSLTEREQWWIDKLGLANLYNKAPAAGSCRGFKASEETKRKMSMARLGVKKTPEHAAKIGLAHKGRKKSAEQVAKMRLYKPTDKTRLRLSIAQYMYLGRRKAAARD